MSDIETTLPMPTAQFGDPNDIHGCEFDIEYVDSKNEKTKRKIIIKNISLNDGEIYINAYCHLRESLRMFLAENIKKIRSTKYKIDDAYKFFAEAYYNSREYEVFTRLNQFEAVVCPLLFIIRADGRVPKKGYNFLINKLQTFFKEPMEDLILEQLMGWKVTDSLSEYRHFLKILASDTVKNQQIVLDISKQIIESKKTVSPIQKGLYLSLVEAF